MLKLSIEFKITCNKWEWGSLPGGEHRQFGAVETLHLKIHFPSLFPQHSRFSGYQQEAWSYLCPLLSLFQPVLQRTHILVSSRSWRKIVLFRRTRSRGRFLISQEMFLEQTLAGLRSLKIFTTSHFSVTSCFIWYKQACLVDLFFSLFKKIPTGSWSYNICLTISFLPNEKDYWGAATHSTGSIVTALICILELGLTTASPNITLATYGWHLLQRFKNLNSLNASWN